MFNLDLVRDIVAKQIDRQAHLDGVREAVAKLSREDKLTIVAELLIEENDQRRLDAPSFQSVVGHTTVKTVAPANRQSLVSKVAPKKPTPKKPAPTTKAGLIRAFFQQSAGALSVRDVVEETKIDIGTVRALLTADNGFKRVGTDAKGYAVYRMTRT